MWKLSKNQTRVRFEKRIKELVRTEVPDLWKTFENKVLNTCNEV